MCVTGFPRENLTLHHNGAGDAQRNKEICPGTRIFHAFVLFLLAIVTLRALPVFELLRARSTSADTIFIGRFLTLDLANPQGEAIAVSAGRILAVGTRSDVEKLASNATRFVKFSGVALPGFADAHIHVAGIGAQLERLDLRGLTKDEILAKVSRAARSVPPGAWILGEGWDEGFWRPPVFPTAKELDRVSGDHPVLLSRIDGHSTWVNSRVLGQAKISRDTPDPQGGLIRRDSACEPTGMLVDSAQELIRSVIPKPIYADKERCIRAALRQLTRWGLTSVHDAGADLDTIAIYKNLLKNGELPVRIYAMVVGENARNYYLRSGPEPDLGNGMLAVRSFKLFLDGALGSRGAELTAPYTDAPGERGLQLMTDAELAQIVQEARKKGFQVNIHAIGDRAVTRALDALENAGVRKEERFRVEHASMVTDDDLPRLAGLHIIASIQPVFVGEYSRWAEDRVGSTRVHWVLRTRDLLNAGVALAAGTDYPDSDSGSPIANLYCLITRRSAAGKPEPGWHSEQSVDVDRALRMLTGGPALAAFQEKDLGSLTVGRFADFTVLSEDPYSVPINDLRTLTVRMTVVGGRVTFDANRN
jgi:predicted amidohydrolase YtcJ